MKIFFETIPFDDEEKNLVESVENDDNWQTASDFAARKKEIIEEARNTNRKKPNILR